MQREESWTEREGEKLKGKLDSKRQTKNIHPERKQTENIVMRKEK